MATIASDLESHEHRDGENVVAHAKGLLGLLGSLKLTVALFAFSLVTVLVGTLAQDEMNMLEVKQRYFVSWIATAAHRRLLPAGLSTARSSRSPA